MAMQETRESLMTWMPEDKPEVIFDAKAFGIPGLKQIITSHIESPERDGVEIILGERDKEVIFSRDEILSGIKKHTQEVFVNRLARAMILSTQVTIRTNLDKLVELNKVTA